MSILKRFEEQLAKLSVEQKEKYNKVLDILVPDLIEPVKEIENGPKLTQHHYGRYLTILSVYSKNKQYAGLIGVALIKAGANEAGVEAAFKNI